MHAIEPPASSPIVFVVDDDAAVRASVVSLLESADFVVRSFASARDFLATPLPQEPASW